MVIPAARASAASSPFPSSGGQTQRTDFAPSRAALAMPRIASMPGWSLSAQRMTCRPFVNLAKPRVLRHALAPNIHVDDMALPAKIAAAASADFSPSVKMTGASGLLASLSALNGRRNGGARQS